MPVPESRVEMMGHAISVISCLAIILLVQPMVARSDFLSSLPPFLSPILDDVCKEVECGRGTCKPSNSSAFLFECECEAGWRRISSHNDTNFNFLPCAIPNCTLDYSCQAAPSPSPDRAARANESIFDPCFWMDCGGGSCNKKSTFNYDCSCAEGYYNLLNVTSLPCYRECAIGTDCMNLGVGITNKSTTTPSPISSENGNNQAGSSQMRNIHWLTVLMISLGLIWWT